MTAHSSIAALESFAAQLASGPFTAATPERSLQRAEADYSRTLALALAGDAAAVELLPDVAGALVEWTRAFYASSMRFFATRDRVAADIERVLQSLREAA